MSITVTVTPPSVVPSITSGAVVTVAAGAAGVGKTTVGAALRLSVANIDDPSTELAALGDSTWPAGTIAICTQDVAGANAYRVYVLDLASSTAQSTPNRIDRAAGGQWILEGGKGVAGSFTVETTLAVGGAATVGGTFGVTGAATFASTLSAGAATLASATITGAATVGTTLTVTGTTTAAAINASGNVTISNASLPTLTLNNTTTASSSWVFKHLANGDLQIVQPSQNTWLTITHANGKITSLGPVVISDGTASTSNTTGAVVVAGGVGVTGGATIGGQIATGHSGANSASGVYVSAAVPGFALNATGEGADGKRWATFVSGSTLFWRVVSDDDNSATNWLLVDRTGMTVNTLTFPNGSVIVSGALSAGTAAIGSAAANALNLTLNAVTTAGESFGARFLAGTNSSDYAFRIRNAGDTATLFEVRGDGSAQLGTTYAAGAPAATGYITIRDSTGTVYKILVST